MFRCIRLLYIPQVKIVLTLKFVHNTLLSSYCKVENIPLHVISKSKGYKCTVNMFNLSIWLTLKVVNFSRRSWEFWLMGSNTFQKKLILTFFSVKILNFLINWGVWEPFSENWWVRLNPSNPYQLRPWISYSVLKYILEFI